MAAHYIIHPTQPNYSSMISSQGRSAATTGRARPSSQPSPSSPIPSLATEPQKEEEGCEEFCKFASDIEEEFAERFGNLTYISWACSLTT